ncbi:MAG: Holliday junction resolvase RuvX [Gammaproteobacteria bacterium]
MPNGTILGFDFGMKRIGVAVGQLFTQMASPLRIIPAKQGTPDWNIADQIINEWQPAALVVGIPLNMDGSTQPITGHAKHFAKLLQQRYNLPVYTADERLTTREARDQIFSVGGYRALQKKPVDSLAAQIILQAWLSSSAPNNLKISSQDQNIE